MGVINMASPITDKKGYKMTHKNLTRALLGFAFTGLLQAAPGDAVTHTFSNNTVADATQVNTNFSDVVAQISDLNTSLSTQISAVNSSAATYSFRDYTHTKATKTFTVTDPLNNSYDQEVRTFTRTAGQIVMRRERTLAGVFHRTTDVTFDTATSNLFISKLDAYDASNTLVKTFTLSPGIILRTETMKEGASFASDSKVTVTVAAAAEGTVIEKGTLTQVGLSITVPQGSHTGCIQIIAERASDLLGTGIGITRVATYCPDVGLVRLVISEPYVSGTLVKQNLIVHELASFTN